MVVQFVVELDKMHRAEKKFHALAKRIKQSGVKTAALSKLQIVRKMRDCPQPNSKSYLLKVAVLVAGCALLYFASTPAFDKTSQKCLLKMPVDSSKIFREPENCRMCKHVDQVDRIQNVSSADFEEIYVKNVKPVVVSDGTRGWETEAFSFEFFKQIYQEAPDQDLADTCQFFPYKTEFESLQEVFNMSLDRAALAPGTLPWYVGWSNCNEGAGRRLKDLYKKPYFLSEKSEHIATNWIFMGGPGYGAHMHVDNVHYPSWQAQLKGRKLWILAPPPECYFECKFVQVTVEPGEIIVIDTNKWYHQTFVLPGDISITIGLEFD